MNIYMEQILKDIVNKQGKTINYLIKCKVLTCNYVVNKAIESKDTRIMYKVAKYLEDISYENIEKLADAIIKENDLDMICEYVIYIKGAPKDKIVDYIIKNGGAEHMVMLATDLEDAPIDELEKAIIKTGSAEHIYYFCINVTNQGTGYDYDMIKRLGNAIALTGNAEYIYEFAQNIYGAPMDVLAKAIMATKNVEYITKFRELDVVPLPPYFSKAIDKANLEQTPEKEKIESLFGLICANELETIEFNADVYRKLLVDTDEELKEIEEEIKHKKRVLTPQSHQYPKIHESWLEQK